MIIGPSKMTLYAYFFELLDCLYFEEQALYSNILNIIHSIVVKRRILQVSQDSILIITNFLHLGLQVCFKVFTEVLM